jgi:hypothetical protein
VGGGGEGGRPIPEAADTGRVTLSRELPLLLVRKKDWSLSLGEGLGPSGRVCKSDAESLVF